MLHWPLNLKRFGFLEDFEMSDDKRGLGRGLGDLMAQNEMDLPFLSAYGPASDVEEDITQAKFPPEEIFDAVVRHLRSLGCKTDSIEDRKLSIQGLIVTIDEEGVLLIFEDQLRLPFVPSDLASPGLSEGQIDMDGCRASVKIQAWGIEARRCLSRFIEHVALNAVE